MNPSLRNRAEALLAKSPAETPALPTRDVQELVHELQVHQAELEIQNVELRRTQQELIEARDRYLELYQSVPVGCLTLDARRTIRDANAAAVAMLGGEGRELVGQRLDKFVAPEDADACYLHLRQAEEAGKPQRRDIRFRRGDGSLFWADLQILPAQPPSAGFRLTLNDITEKRAAESELRQAYKREQDALAAAAAARTAVDALDAMGEGVLLTDMQGRILSVNPALQRMLGYRQEAVVGQPVESFVARLVAEEDRARVLDAQRSAFQGQPVGAACFTLVLQGRRVPVISAISFIHDAAGRPTALVSTLRDISELSAARQTLEESEHKYRELVAHLPVGVIVVDPSTRVVESVNARAAAMFGCAADRIVGRRCHSFLCPAEEQNCPVLDLGQAVDDSERVMLHADGSRHPVLKSVTRIQLNGQEKLLECFVDIAARKQAEAALQASETRFREMAMSMREVFWMRTPDLSKMLYVSPSFEKVWGRPLQSVMKGPMAWVDAIHPADRDRVRDALAQHAQGHYDVEYRIVQPGGAVRWIHDRGIPVRGDDGQILRMVGIAEDITEGKQAADALRASERKYRELVENANSIIMRITPDHDITFFNEYAQAFFGYTAEEILGKNVRGTIVPWADTAGRDLYAMLAQITAHPDQYVSNDNENICKDGRRVWVHWSNRAIRDDQGNVVELLCVGTDITARKQAVSKLRESEAKFRGLFESASDAIMTLAPPDWKFTSANPATVTMFRAKDESEFISMGPADLSPARQPDGRASAEKAREMIETAMRNGSHFFSWTHRRIDGEEFFANVRLTRMEQDGKVMLQAIVRDITERVQRDAEARHYQQRLRELTERLAATEEEDRWRISRYIHDTIIQNLSLSSIRLGAVAKPLADAELKEEADKLHQVRSLIDQSIDECRMVMSDLTPTLLYELGLVPALNDFAQQVAAKHGTRVSVEDDGQEKPIAPPLRGLLFESTRELVVNALKHAGPCEIRVSVSCRGGALVVRVADNGQGFNTGKAMTPNHHGGFGLFSIRQRLEGLGGRLELESAPGRGTTATIIVPMGEEPGG